MSTQAYVDLMFAWGHARLGDAETARQLTAEAERLLRPSGDPAHAWLMGAFNYRIDQAIANQPHQGSLPSTLAEQLDRIDEARLSALSARYATDRLRASSRILEPAERPDPYTPWKKGPPGPEWYRRATTAPGPPGEWLDEKYADLIQLADHAGPGVGMGSLVHPQGTERFVTALEAAQWAELAEAVNARLADLRRHVEGGKPTSGPQLYLLLALSAALLRLGRKTEAAALADEHRAAELGEYQRSNDPDRLAVCLRLAALDFWLGRTEFAIPILESVLRTLPQLEVQPVRVRLIGEYLETIAWARWPDSSAHLRAMLQVLPRFSNRSTTSGWYSLLHLEIAERVVLALATPNFGPPGDVLRSMPEPEIAARREALAEVRGRLVEWGRPDWGPPTRS